jgi:hypothetical protein
MRTDFNENEIISGSSWHTRCSFYADTSGNVSRSGADMYLLDVTFYCLGPGIKACFQALDVYYTDKVLKSHVEEFLEGKRAKVRRANVFKAIAAETLTSIEMADGSALFVKFANLEFKQLLSIAQAKQKYSKTVADRN